MMILASGFVETNEPGDALAVADRLEARRIEISDIGEDRILFLIERETASEVKTALNSMKDIEGIRNVYLAYFSIEGSDREITDVLS